MKTTSKENSVLRVSDTFNNTSHIINNTAEKQKRKGKVKYKAGKKRKKKKVMWEERNESDFSDDDNIPLANHLDSSAGKTLLTQSFPLQVLNTIKMCSL